MTAAALVLEDARTPTPPRLTCLRLVADETNATVVETFRLHYAGRLGSPRFVRTVAAGTRVRAGEWDGEAGLCRVWLDPADEEGALVEASHVRPDEGIPS